jgi:hypothetical protein
LPPPAPSSGSTEPVAHRRRRSSQVPTGAATSTGGVGTDATVSVVVAPSDDGKQPSQPTASFVDPHAKRSPSQIWEQYNVIFTTPSHFANNLKM